MGAYLALVVGLELLRHFRGVPDPADLASSPQSLAAGRVWLMVTSGVIVSGAPVGQLLGFAVTAVIALRVLGARTFWTAALTAHLGSAVLVYAGVGVLELLDTGAVEEVAGRADYGISCVWLGVAGALAGARMDGVRTGVAIGAVTVVSALLWVTGPPDDLAGVEHALAFALGALVGASAGGARRV